MFYSRWGDKQDYVRYVLVESVKVNFWITLETDVFGLVSCTNHKDGC